MKVDLPAWHVHILEIRIVGASFEDQDFDIGGFGEAACDHTAGGASAVEVSACAYFGAWLPYPQMT